MAETPVNSETITARGLEIRPEQGWDENRVPTDGRRLSKPKIVLIIVALGFGLAFLGGSIVAMVPIDDGIRNWAGGRVGFDFVAFHAGARLAVTGRAASAYVPEIFHATEQALVRMPTGESFREHPCKKGR